MGHGGRASSRCFKGSDVAGGAHDIGSRPSAVPPRRPTTRSVSRIMAAVNRYAPCVGGTPLLFRASAMSARDLLFASSVRICVRVNRPGGCTWCGTVERPRGHQTRAPTWESHRDRIHRAADRGRPSSVRATRPAYAAARSRYHSVRRVRGPPAAQPRSLPWRQSGRHVRFLIRRAARLEAVLMRP